jgi:replicative DNA helicase
MIPATPPANPEAELAVLGSVLIDPDAIGRVGTFLKPEHFYQQKHAWIYQSVIDLSRRGSPADFVTVCDELERHRQLDEVGGAAYVMDLINAVPTAIHAEYYAEILVKMATDRRAIILAGQIVQEAYAGHGRGLEVASQLLGDARSEFAVASSGPRFLDDVMEELIDRANIMQAERNAGRLVDVKFPWTDLTDIIHGGLLPADLMLVVGEPSVGKSTFVHQLADHAALQGHGVLLFTTETKDRNFASRQLAPRAGVSSRDLIAGQLDDGGWERVMRAMDKVRRPSFLVDSNTYDAQAFERRIQQAQIALERRGATLRLVVFDFLQQFRDSRYKEKRLEVGGVIYQMREIANTYGLAAIVVSELSKDTYKNGGKVHIFGSKESSSIEYAATIGIALYRDEQDRVVCDIQKNKDGKRGRFLLPALAQDAAWFGSARPYTVSGKVVQMQAAA